MCRVSARIRSDLTPLRITWLVLAGVGLILWLADPSWPAGNDWTAITALAIWALVETMLRRNWWALITLPALVLGVGVALPLYLYMRSGRII
ncbi:MAG: hypothetical protein DI498_04130 [Paracoccus denitrificans]|nr:MAG: hypothetical protein DI498_04130 [Paracoccus denitrificans]PZO85325.1 MAG: hypothetical protein DI633_04130 [Paracoccus denitrificans]